MTGMKEQLQGSLVCAVVYGMLNLASRVLLHRSARSFLWTAVLQAAAETRSWITFAVVSAVA